MVSGKHLDFPVLQHSCISYYNSCNLLTGYSLNDLRSSLNAFRGSLNDF